MFHHRTTTLRNGAPAARLGTATAVTGPTGRQGPTGPTGSRGLSVTGPTGRSGAAATVTIGRVSSGVTAAVTNGGSSSAAVLNFTLPVGGPTGSAATVTIGSVSTGASPAVTNVGTPGAAVLNFVLPIGPTGSPGDSVTGPPGRDGPTGSPGPTGAGFSLSQNVYSQPTDTALTSGTTANIGGSATVTLGAGTWLLHGVAQYTVASGSATVSAIFLGFSTVGNNFGALSKSLSGLRYTIDTSPRTITAGGSSPTVEVSQILTLTTPLTLYFVTLLGYSGSTVYATSTSHFITTRIA